MKYSNLIKLDLVVTSLVRRLDQGIEINSLSQEYSDQYSCGTKYVTWYKGLKVAINKFSAPCVQRDWIEVALYLNGEELGLTFKFDAENRTSTFGWGVYPLTKKQKKVDKVEKKVRILLNSLGFARDNIPTILFNHYIYNKSLEQY